VVLFLDNMQWSDAATCSALEALFEGQNGRYLMCVCAVSEREGQASPALSRLIERLGSAQTRVRRLALQPLSRQDLADFLRDTMRGRGGRARQ
jgi:predicted ATPase